MNTAAKIPHPISPELGRAELQVVLESELFTRAPTLAHLLSYLCEKSFAGESSQIKEYSVGIDVFHRRADFDQDADSIVRVQANRLRKRLAEYYAGQGASHSLRITIPIGQYIPAFQVADDLLESTDAPESTAPIEPSTAESSLFRTPLPWILLAGCLLMVMLGVGMFFLYRGRAAAATPALRYQPMTVESQPVGLPMGEELHILAGATRSYVDHAGKLWTADAFYTGGSAIKSDVQHIWRTQDPSFYRSSRQGTFRYDLPLKRGIYELRLHFAENYYGPENIGSGGDGSRSINVLANGKPLLTDLDVVADAGGSATADLKVFSDIAPAPDGFLHLAFSSGNGDNAMLSAIEVLPGIRAHIRPIRILARQSPYYSNDSHWWSPDNYFKGGQLATDTEPVRGTDDPELYEGGRWGNFSYAIPVTRGRYNLILYFSVRPLRHKSPADVETEQVDRTFNVFCDGKGILENFDLQREAGDGDIVVRHFTGLEPNAQGKLLLEFVPVKGYATITGIEVLPQ